MFSEETHRPANDRRSTSPTPSTASARELVAPVLPGAPAGMAKGAGKGPAPVLALQPPTPIVPPYMSPPSTRTASPTPTAAQRALPASRPADDSDEDDDMPLSNLRSAASQSSLSKIAAGAAAQGRGSLEYETLADSTSRPHFAEPATEGSRQAAVNFDGREGRAFSRQGNERRSVSNLQLPVSARAQHHPPSASSMPSSPVHTAGYKNTIGGLGRPIHLQGPPSPLGGGFGRSSSAGELSVHGAQTSTHTPGGSTSTLSTDPDSFTPRTPRDSSPISTAPQSQIGRVPSAERLDSPNSKWQQARRVGQPLSQLGGGGAGMGGSQMGAGGRPIPRSASSAPILSSPGSPAKPMMSAMDRMKARHKAETREALSIGRDLNGPGPRLADLEDEDEDDDAPLASLPSRFGGSVAGSSLGGHGGGGGGSMMGGRMGAGGGGSMMSGMGGGGSRPGSAMGGPMMMPQPMMMHHQPVTAGGYAQMAYPPPGVDAFLYASLPNDQKLALHQRSGQMMAMMQHAALTARAESVVGGGSAAGSVHGGGSQIGGGSSSIGHAAGRSMSVSSGMGAMGGMPGMPQMSMMPMMAHPQQQGMMHPMMLHQHQSMFNLGAYGAFPVQPLPQQQQHQHRNQFLPAFAPQFGVDPWAQQGAMSMMGMPTAYAGSEMGGSLGRRTGKTAMSAVGRSGASTMSAAVRR